MTCLIGDGITICRPDIVRLKKSRRQCPTDGRRTTFISRFYEWYGWTVTCLSCGDEWQDGEMLERPFRPGWRKESIAHARKLWADRSVILPEGSAAKEEQ